uniref:Cytochrome c oxidase subunit 6b-1 n=1 Tax=Noccaea caerulescens TaxID=107243 RepID=A0A1J3H6T8_NOCCA
MAEAVAAQTPSLSEQYHLEKEVKQDTSAKPVEAKEVTPEVTEEVSKDQAKEESPAEEAVSAVEEKSEPPSSTEEVPAAAEEAPPAAEETNEENTSEEVPEETPDEIKLETAPADFRFPTTNQTRHCFTRYIEYHRCVAAKGDEAPECDKFAKFYRSLCPSEWVDRWNEQRENGTFPGPL